MKIAISHSTQENPVAGGGASVPPRWEQDLTEPVADRAADLLRQLGYDARSDWPHTKVGDVITAVNAWRADLVIDIHTDAYQGTSRGTSAFWYPNSSKGEKLARALAVRVGAVSGKLRGVYARADLGILASTDMPAALVELDFHDSLAGAIHIWENRWAFARAVAQAVLDYLGDTRTLPGDAAPAPADPLVAPAPAPAPARAGLVADGVLGPKTYRALQQWLGVPADGIWGPRSKRALQYRLGVKADGIIGPVTVRALQRLVGAPQDGVWGPRTTRSLQGYLNAVLKDGAL